MLVVHPALPAPPVKELIALARARSGELNYGSSGPGAADHMAAELFQVMTKTRMVHVPYKGGPLAMVDLISGNSQAMFSTVPIRLGPRSRPGSRAPWPWRTARSLRDAGLPPTAEAGAADFAVNNWCGVFVVSGTPASVIARPTRSSRRRSRTA